MSRTLVAGIGNIFFGDDAFGVAVAGRLAGRALPEGVRVEDFGIRSVHLAYELLDGYDTLVLVDALATGETPGTVSVFEPSLDDLPAATMDAHTMDPATVLATLAGLGGEVGRVLIVGCEPEGIDEGMGLSPPVAAAIDIAAETVMDLVGATRPWRGDGNTGDHLLGAHRGGRDRRRGPFPGFAARPVALPACQADVMPRPVEVA